MKLTDLAAGTAFFRGLSPHDLDRVLLRLNGVKRVYAKGEIVVNAGLPAERLFVVLSGHLHVYEQMTDERPVLAREIGAGEVVGLWILFVPEVTCWPGSLVAKQASTLVSLDLARARDFVLSSDPLAARLSLNASRLLSRELFATWRKLAVMDAATIEARIQVYLSELNNETGRTGQVTIPFDRERMAEYFGVTRPALSRVLGLMRDRGLLTWRKNRFRINF